MDTVVSTKGQIVIPKRLRDKWGLASGSRVRIESTSTGIQIRGGRAQLQGGSQGPWPRRLQGQDHRDRRHGPAHRAQGVALIALDTNVLARFYLNDEPGQAQIAARLLMEEDVFIPKTVLLELEWVVLAQ